MREGVHYLFTGLFVICFFFLLGVGAVALGQWLFQDFPDAALWIAKDVPNYYHWFMEDATWEWRCVIIFVCMVVCMCVASITED